MAATDADVFAVQETKLQEGQISLDLPGYHQTWSYAERKGYSGTAVFCREEPLQVINHIGAPEADDEGRVCALEFPTYWFVDVYTPNAQNELARIDTRLAWDAAYREFLVGLAAKKPVVTCGDFNVAHNEIDLKNPGPNRGNAGFSDEERESFTRLLDAGFTDTFRARHPDVDRRLQLVELPLQRAQEQRGLAHRLLPRVQRRRRPRDRCLDPLGGLRLGPLPRGAHDRALAEGRDEPQGETNRAHEKRPERPSLRPSFSASPSPA